MRLRPERHIQPLQAHKLREGTRQTSRHKSLCRHRQIQGLRVYMLGRAEVEFPRPRERLDSGTAGERAAAAPVVEIQIEFRYAPDAFAGPVVNDDSRGPE